jgi:hypothetical protein
VEAVWPESVRTQGVQGKVRLLVVLDAQDHVSPSAPGPMTEFMADICRIPSEHKIRIGQVAKWAKHSTGPVDYQAAKGADIARPE